MKYILGKNDWYTRERDNEHCWLLTNGLGGFSSLTAASACARGDHALFMGAKTAPNERVHMVTNVYETLTVSGKSFDFSSQQYVSSAKNKDGHQYLQHFTFEYFPNWYYRAGGVSVEKTVVMPHFKNMLAVAYKVTKTGKEPVSLEVTPLLRMTKKDERMAADTVLEWKDGESGPCIYNPKSGLKLYFVCSGHIEKFTQTRTDDLYFAKDAVDGRDAYGIGVSNHKIIFEAEEKVSRFYVLYSMEPLNLPDDFNFDALAEKELMRQKEIEKRCGLHEPAAVALARAADAYIVKRDSTKELSIIAGYPFFGDWGRDTMIALPGCTLAAGQPEAAKSILLSFMKYCRKGLMPNLFPEGTDKPLYNTADAALLFINAVYLYYEQTGDSAFLAQALPVMKEIIEWYKKGTDYNIHMDSDGLIIAGEGLWQVTWMDVRFEDILPTPRHGKPVEINAYWYNALKIMETLLDRKYAGADTGCIYTDSEYGRECGKLARQVKISFNEKFWNEQKQCLKDVLSLGENKAADTQVRCNQIWALSLPFTMPEKDAAEKILAAAKQQLLTPWGLRSLSPDDEQFHASYGGSQFLRDMAYHQGTVWAYPLGAFYMAKIKYADDKKAAARQVLTELEAVTAAMAEGCLGHIAEIYDGQNPCISKGCFAQAWSVGEILRAYKEAEKIVYTGSDKQEGAVREK